MTLNGSESTVISAIAPLLGGLDFLGLGSAPSPVPTASIDLNQVVNDLTAALQQSDGTLTVDKGILTSDLVSPLGNFVGTYNLVDLLNQAAADFQDLSGTVTIENGTLAGDLSTGDDLLTGSLQFSNLIGDVLTDALTDLSGTAPFANGQFEVALPTPFGTVNGTLNFGNGALVSRFTTPFGDVNYTLDFGEDFQIPFTVASGTSTIPVVLDLSNGIVGVDLVPATAGTEVSIPINTLAGDLTFNHGQVAIAIPTALGTLGGTFDLVQLVNTEVVPFLNSVSGTLSVADGLLTADLTTSAGSFSGTLNGGQFLEQLTDVVAGTSGTVTIGDGVIVSNLTTPIGDLVGTLEITG